MTATEKRTGLRQNIVIDRSNGSTEEKEREPEDGAPVAGFDILPEAAEDLSATVAPGDNGHDGAASLDPVRVRETVERVRGLFDSMPSEDRQEAADLIETVTDGLEGGRLAEAQEAYAELQEILFYVEER